jgi:hypothetical protein
MADQTFKELLPMAIQILDNGGKFWAKFTCGHCGARQTFDVPNIFYTSGKCEECEQITVLQKYGLLVLKSLWFD